jgi:hypothetical protein
MATFFEVTMTVTPARIEALLSLEGWPLTRVDDVTWRTQLRGELQQFQLFVRMSDSWIFFSIVPFVLAPREAEAALRLYRLLLRLNREINLAKFALDEDADVVLTVELPTQSLDDSEVRDALDALGYYADRHYLTVLETAAGRSR